ncbi:MAG: DUF1592 domain-containing protein [Myxococcota bacterium]|nr:DUF1592 domain-containing protein [Myxococcota bacterium]
MNYRCCLLSACLLAVGCTEAEQSFDGPMTLEDIAPADAYGVEEPGASSLRRLTQSQFQQSVRSLLGDEIVIPKLSEPDASVSGLLSIGASTTTFSPRGVESLETVAYSIAEQAVETERFRALMTCTPTGTVDAPCAKQVIEAFGRLAWRRAMTAAEADELTSVATTAAQVLGDFNRGLEYAVAAILQSPYFLFRVELATETEDSKVEFGPYELASRLSYFFWNTTPDETLLAAAERGDLGTREGLFEQASRLMEHANTRAGVRNFFIEQLQLYKLDSFAKDPTIFEHFHSDLGDNAREETLQFLEYVVFDGNEDFRDVMTADYSFVNARLAALYGMPAPVMEGFGYTDLYESTQRAGLLGHASFLGLHSHPVSSSATLRGKAVRNIFLCQQIPNPPVAVDTSIPEPSGTTLTLRDRVAEHLTEPSCAGCHQLTDPIGLGLENFDGIARWRDTDSGAEIDPSGDLDGQPFEDMKGLGEAIRNHPAFAPCMVQTLAQYGMGRVTNSAERKWLNTLSERFETHGFRLRRLMLEFVMSPLFDGVAMPPEGEVAP